MWLPGVEQGQDVEGEPLQRHEVQVAAQVGEVIGAKGENQPGDKGGAPVAGQVADQQVGAVPGPDEAEPDQQVLDRGQG